MPRSQVAALAAVAAFALVVRLVAAATCGPINDEAFTAYLSQRSWAEILVGSRPDNNPPLYYLLLHPLATTTWDVLVLRLPSVLAGSAAAAVTAWAGLRLGAGWWPGVLVACAWPVWLADAEIRQYGPYLLGSAGALALSLEASRRTLRRCEVAVYAACCALMPLLSYGGFVVVGALLAAALVRRSALLAGATLLALAPGVGWLAYAVSGPTHSDLLRSVFGPPGLVALVQVPGYLTGLTMPIHWFSATRGSALVLYWEAALALGLGALAAWGFRRLRAGGRAAEAGTLALVFLLPLGGLLLIGATGAQAFQSRYLVPVTPALFLLLCAAPWGRVVAWAVLVVNLGTLALFPSTPYLWNQDWPAAARWIRARQAPGDVLAVWRPYSLTGLNFSYAPGAVAMDFRQAGRLAFTYGPGYDGPPQVALPGPDAAAALDSPRVLLVLSPWDDPRSNGIIEPLNRRYEVADALVLDSVNGWGRLAVYLLQRKAP